MGFETVLKFLFHWDMFKQKKHGDTTENVDASEIQRSPPKNKCFYLPSSTGDFRISEPSSEFLTCATAVRRTTMMTVTVREFPPVSP